MLDNVELIMYMTFQKHLMTGCRYMEKNIKIPQNGGFPHLSLLYPYGSLTSCKKLEKTNERSLRYLKTDGPRAFTKDPLGRTQGPTEAAPTHLFIAA